MFVVLKYVRFGGPIMKGNFIEQIVVDFEGGMLMNYPMRDGCNVLKRNSFAN